MHLLHLLPLGPLGLLPRRPPPPLGGGHGCLHRATVFCGTRPLAPRLSRLLPPSARLSRCLLSAPVFREGALGPPLLLMTGHGGLSSGLLCGRLRQGRLAPCWSADCLWHL